VEVVEIPETTERTPRVSFQATITAREQVVLGTIDGEVIAVAKLAREHGAVILRGVQVAERWRGHGIGRRLMEAVAQRAGREPCFVIALGPLEGFYAEAGFVRASDAIPDFIVERCAHYRSKGDDVFVARRSADLEIDAHAE